MSNLTKAIYEHLITKKKYNSKCIECEALKEDIARINIRMNEQKEKFEVIRKEWEEKLKDQEEQIIKLKKKNIKLKEEKK